MITFEILINYSGMRTHTTYCSKLTHIWVFLCLSDGDILK